MEIKTKEEIINDLHIELNEKFFSTGGEFGVKTALNKAYDLGFESCRDKVEEGVKKELGEYCDKFIKMHNEANFKSEEIQKEMKSQTLAKASNIEICKELVLKTIREVKH